MLRKLLCAAFVALTTTSLLTACGQIASAGGAAEGQDDSALDDSGRDATLGDSTVALSDAGVESATGQSDVSIAPCPVVASADSGSPPLYIKPLNNGAHGPANEEFGRKIAFSADGNTIVVGAHYESGGGSGPNADPFSPAVTAAAGAVYLVTRTDGGAWTESGYLKASNTAQRNFDEASSRSLLNFGGGVHGIMRLS
jgi:hypothetical protein